VLTAERLGQAISALVLAFSLLLVASGAAAESPHAALVPPGEAAVGGVAVAPEFDPLFDEDPALEDPDSQRDPLEGLNRAFFAFNEGVDWAIWSPMTVGYQFVVPEPARRGIHRVFLNLNAPSIVVNKLLQLEFGGATKALARFALNTTVGWGGLFDAGVAAGWEPDHADFGQTLALVGVPSGPYLVLPLLGPTTVRDGLGDAVDQFLHPMTYFLGPAQQLFVGTGRGLSIREAHCDELEALRDSSVDFYSVFRSAYLQNREAEI